MTSGSEGSGLAGVEGSENEPPNTHTRRGTELARQAAAAALTAWEASQEAARARGAIP